MDIEFLLQLHDRGAGIIPLRDDGVKSPPITWKQYQPSPKDGSPGIRPSKELIKEWHKKYKNFGLILGWGFYALDFDTPTKEATELHPETVQLLDFLLCKGNVWVQKTGHQSNVRRHLIYRKDPGKLLPYIQHLEKYPGLEILGENHILVLAGSRHKSGWLYETIVNPFLEEVINVSL